MRLIKLCYEDPCIFGAELTCPRCDFLKNNMDKFMTMYETQGSTFWLRFLITFKCYIEDKVVSSEISVSDLMEYVKSVNYICVYIHKQFIEGSNSTIKNFLNSLIFLGKNSPQLFNFNSKKWLDYLCYSQQLQNTLKNLLGIPIASKRNEFLVVIYAVLSDFSASLCAIFELWEFSCDLTEEEAKLIDTKIIYWQRHFTSSTKYFPLCFEKYVANYWKAELGKIFLVENVQMFFIMHGRETPCNCSDIQENLFQLFTIKSKDARNILKIYFEMCQRDHGTMKTSVVCSHLCNLRAKPEKCKNHKKCLLKIKHHMSCFEPFMCRGDKLCYFTCETSLKDSEEETQDSELKFTVEVFPLLKNKREVATGVEEVYKRNFETFVHIPSELAACLSRNIIERANTEASFRKAETINRLRRKLQEKYNDDLEIFCKEDFKEDTNREALLNMAFDDMDKFEAEFPCGLEGVKDHFICDCSVRFAFSKCNDSNHMYGRVINFKKTVKMSKEPSNKPCTCPKENENKPDSIAAKISNHVSDASESITEPNTNSISVGADSISIKSTVPKVLDSESCSQATSTKLTAAGTHQICENGENGLLTHQTPETDIVTVQNGLSVKPKIKKNAKNGLVSASYKNSEISDVSSKPKVKSNSLPKNSTIELPKDHHSNAKLCSISNKAENKLPADNSAEAVIDEVDEILKFISNDETTNAKRDGSISGKNNDEALDNFFNLIGLKELSSANGTGSKEGKSKGDKDDKRGKLKVCAYCQKKEVERKTFKRCSKCKEENFPVHRFYCSRECQIEDWMESHEEEHQRKQKQLY